MRGLRDAAWKLGCQRCCVLKEKTTREKKDDCIMPCCGVFGMLCLVRDSFAVGVGGVMIVMTSSTEPSCLSKLGSRSQRRHVSWHIHVHYSSLCLRMSQPCRLCLLQMQAEPPRVPSLICLLRRVLAFFPERPRCSIASCLLC